jgi:multidrug resistance protein, MATE family
VRASLRALLILAWPIVISRATQTVVGLADALMVAHLGPNALAATTTGALNTFLVLILPMGTVFIVGSFASQLMGLGDLAGARRFALYGLVVSVVTQIVSMAFVPLLSTLFDLVAVRDGNPIGLLDYDPEMRTQLIGYLGIRLLGAGPAIGLEALGGYYGGLGKTRVPMIANLVAMLLNVGLNYVLIDGHFGAPRLGVEGAAIASAVSTTLSFLGLFAFFVREGAWPRFVMRELVRTLRFGLPSGVNWFFEFLAFAYFANVVVVSLGTAQLAALNSVMQINSVSFMPAFGIATAGAILVGQSIGAGDRDRVPGLVKLTFGVAATWQVLVGVLYAAIPSVLFSPFAAEPESRAVMMEIGVRMLMLSAAWQLFDSAQTVLAEALRAAGDTLWPLAVRIVIAWVVFVPGTTMFVTEGGAIPGDVLAVGWLVLYLALLALALFLRFASGRWRALELVEPSAEDVTGPAPGAPSASS